jgi:hypothetical protein
MSEAKCGTGFPAFRGVYHRARIRATRWLMAGYKLLHSNFMSRHFVTSDPSPELMMMQPRTLRAVLSLAHTA